MPSVEDAFEIGEKVLVTVKEIDDMHRVNLSRKKLLRQARRACLPAPNSATRIPAEKEREERYSQFPRGGGERREGGRDRDRGGRDRDRDRGERPRARPEA